jgi:hypothetical protein
VTGIIAKAPTHSRRPGPSRYDGSTGRSSDVRWVGRCATSPEPPSYGATAAQDPGPQGTSAQRCEPAPWMRPGNTSRRHDPRRRRTASDITAPYTVVAPRSRAPSRPVMGCWGDPMETDALGLSQGGARAGRTARRTPQCVCVVTARRFPNDHARQNIPEPVSLNILEDLPRTSPLRTVRQNTP